MNLNFKTEDQKYFLEKIGYIVEYVTVSWMIDGGRHLDASYNEGMYIAYKNEKPKTDLGYSGNYNFENKYKLSNVFEKEFPTYLVKSVIENIRE